MLWRLKAMEIKNKLYPYPVLAYFSDEYKNTSSFKIITNIKIEGYREIVEFSALLVNSDLKELISEGKAEIILHLECGQTGYRRVLKFKKNSPELEWKIPNEKIAGRVQVCPFIVSACDIENYSNSEFAEDLSGMSFNVPEGTILAVGQQIDINVHKKTDDLRALPSIFNISMNGDTKQQYMMINTAGDLIEVLIPAKDWQKFCELNSAGKLTGVFSAMIAVPALADVLKTLQEEGQDKRIEYRREENKPWFNCISRTLMEKFEIDIFSEKFDVQDSFQLAQKMINGPFDKALDELWEAD